MRSTRTCILALLSPLVVFFILSLEGPAFSQQTSSSNPQAVALLQKSLAALTGGQPVSDVTLYGTARRIAGSDDETGTAVFKALASGASRTDFIYPSGPRSEVSNLTGASPAGAWSGPDGVSHSTALHNLLSEPGWFFPAFATSRRLSAPDYVAIYVGHETRNGQAVEHIAVSQTPAFTDPPDGATFAHLTQVDFFLDSATLLPTAIAFNIHPDKNALVDLPIDIRFSDYRSISGVQTPFRVQRFLNNGLVLDFQAQTITLNTDLSANLFNIQ